MEATGANLETAQQEPTEETAKSYTQAELDQAVTKAIQTREKNLKAEYDAKFQTVDSEKEQIRLQEAGKFKELWEQSEKEKSVLKLERETQGTLSELKMLDILPVFGNDHNTSDGRKASAAFLQSYLNEAVEKKIAERLTNSQPAKSGPVTTKSIDQMTPAEWSAYKKENNLV